MTTSAPLTSLEIAAGFVFGFEGGAVPLDADPVATARAAMEDAVRTALLRPPCVISFSGGQDSSALLALAVHVARRDGLELPVPATLRFPDAPDSLEDDWQALVLGHLQVPRERQLVFELRDELDVVGDAATDVLRRHGVLWPFNLHFHAPIVAAASGGSLITGFGGDEIGRLSTAMWAERVLARRRLRRPRELVTVVARTAPRPVRRALALRGERRGVRELTWLTPAAARAVTRGHARTAVRPLGFARNVLEHVPRLRYVRVCVDAFTTLGRDHDVEVHHPFVADPVLRGLAADGGFAGLLARGHIMQHLVGDLLPREVVWRTTKGSFSAPLFTARSREFAEAWSGEGLDAALVRPEVLRTMWRSAEPNVRSATLLQAAWLADYARAAPGSGRR